MCDVCNHVRRGWRGWLPLPKAANWSAAGDWHELSHCLTEEMSRISLLPPPSFRRIRQLPQDPFNQTEINMVAHVGTHLDAPSHFVADGPTADQVPLERMMGRGVVWRIRKEELGLITVDDLERATPKMEAGDIVLLSTGYAEKFGSKEYDNHLSLTVEAAEWLVQQGAKLIGMDCPTPDLPVHVRSPDFQWPVHQVLLSQGVLIAEHVTNIAAFEEQHIEAMMAGLNIKGSDGMPVRALARKITLN